MALIDRILERIVKWRGFVLVREDMYDRMLELIPFPTTVRISWSEPDQDSPTPWGAVWNSTEGWHLGPLDRTESSDQSKLESVPDGYRAWHGRWVYGWSDPSAR